MINSRKYLIVFLTVGLGILAACGDSSVESSAKSSNNSSTQNDDSDISNKDETASEERKTENSSGVNDKNQKVVKKILQIKHPQVMKMVSH
ncbi:hypothetical protein [Metabacillus halosaccharovorans]|uniref:hypothetical protein n=1 Tax=Metabacillus halosaccharovorans TaxID=930124 RepID=UPI0020423681|nr:hypothetical protein [Metabacillus halosaccharovorans]MCM3439631.1 hypothetical protein [Metabacillus halosaccharovorans]